MHKDTHRPWITNGPYTTKKRINDWHFSRTGTPPRVSPLVFGNLHALLSEQTCLYIFTTDFESHEATKTNDGRRRSTFIMAYTGLEDSAQGSSEFRAIVVSVFRLFFVVINFRNITGVSLRFPSCPSGQDTGRGRYFTRPLLSTTPLSDKRLTRRLRYPLSGRPYAEKNARTADIFRIFRTRCFNFVVRFCLLTR